MAVATQSEPFATTAAKIAARGGLQMVAAPDPKAGVYNAQRGRYMAVLPPEPVLTPGGGRYNMTSRRVVQVFVVTQSLSDPAGTDALALAAHWAEEDAILDALVDGKSQGVKIGVGAGVHWIPGGDEVRRQFKTDPGILLSVMLFAVEYQAPTTTT